jgi:hypothetical protein
MNSIPDDLAQLLPTRQKRSAAEADDRPIYYLWKFDPIEAKVHITHNEDRHSAEHVTHQSWATHITHPDHLKGYAYSIKGGWRITDDDHNEVKDPFVIRRILAALAGEHPPAPLPQIPHHRS